VGKYLAYAFIVRSGTAYQFGIPPAVLSIDMLRLFRADLRTVFGLLDILWFGSAVASAGLIARPEWPEVEAPDAVQPPGEALYDLDGLRLGSPHVAPVYHSRNPIDRLARRLPQPWRTIVDWTLTIAGAIAIVLLIKAYVVNPYRIPSSSMEPTLHCARPAATARRASPTASSRTASSTASETRVAARSLSSRRRPPPRSSAAPAGRSSSASSGCRGYGRSAGAARQRLRLHQRAKADRALHPGDPSLAGYQYGR